MPGSRATPVYTPPGVAAALTEAASVTVLQARCDELEVQARADRKKIRTLVLFLVEQGFKTLPDALIEDAVLLENLPMIFEFIAKRIDKMFPSAASVGARGTGMQSLAVAQVEPPGLEGTRAGLRFMLGNAAAITGIAPVTALPTTAAQWVLWNADTAKTAWFEEVGMYLTAGTPGVGGILLGAIVKAPGQVGDSVTGAAITPCGKSKPAGGSGSSMILKTGVTITDPAAPVWFPIASNPSPNVAIFPRSTFLEHRNLQGKLAIPPGYGLALAVVAPAGTSPLFAPFAQWLEFNTDNE